MSIEAMKQALEALEANQPVNYCMNNNGEKFPMFNSAPLRQERNEKAIASLRQAIEQATTPQPQRERVIFPTMLRKMWSGGEVQAWLDENVNKEKNT